jgi:hypothetical protein
MTENTRILLEHYEELVYVWIGLAVVIFFVLLRITAPYGRHATRQWGPAISNRWAWVIMELPVLVVLFAIVLPVQSQLSSVSWIMIGLFTIHYLNRTLVFPFRLRTKGKTMPLLVVGSGVLFNLLNGWMLGTFFAYLQDYPQEWVTDVRFIGGIVLFLGGVYINWRADDLLIHLRKPGETGYQIPHGWLFEHVSCPNLFGELVEWLGYAVLCWNLPALAFLVWTAANLVPRALSHHRWYRTQFPGYPEDRKAILPYVL